MMKMRKWKHQSEDLKVFKSLYMGREGVERVEGGWRGLRGVERVEGVGG